MNNQIHDSLNDASGILNQMNISDDQYHKLYQIFSFYIIPILIENKLIKNKSDKAKKWIDYSIKISHQLTQDPFITQEYILESLTIDKEELLSINSVLSNCEFFSKTCNRL